MSCRVEWTRAAGRDMARLPLRIVDAVIAYTERLADAPERRSHPLQGELEGLRSARVGDYRILFRHDPTERVIYIRRVDHRAHVYRPR